MLLRYLYSALLYCLVPVLLLRMLLRSRKAVAYRQRLAERFACYAQRPALHEQPTIWVHAVSVGETIAAAPIIEALLDRHPGFRLVVTTTTPTGSERVKTLFGDRVSHVYAPWDLPGAVRRFLRIWRPQLMIIMETELWPNTLHYTHLANCRIVLANARMSERSADGYERFTYLSRPMLQCIDKVAAQSNADGERLLGLGLSPGQLEVTGSIKFDLDLDEQLRTKALQLKQDWSAGDRDILVAASTHPGEDEIILKAFAELRSSQPDCLLVLVPRHPERFSSVAALCRQQGWQVVLRSQGIAPTSRNDIVVGDTMGELLLLLGTASVALIGGSLVEHGGHNVLEASVWGVPVVTGRYMFNFHEISELLRASRAMIVVDNPDQLGASLTELFSDPDKRKRMGEAGLEVVASNRGAKTRLLELVEQQLAEN